MCAGKVPCNGSSDGSRRCLIPMGRDADAAAACRRVGVLSQPDNGTGRYLRKVFSAAVARQQVAPWWRRRPHRSLTSLGQWSWRTETEVDLDYHVRLSALPPRAGTAELWALVSELHAGMLDRSRPLWQVDLIEGLPGGRCAVYVKVHHALADGVSVMRLLQRIVTADPHQRQMPTLWEVPAQASVAKHTAPRGSSRPLTLAKGVLGQARGVPGMVRVVADTTWRAAQCRSGPLTLAAPHTPLNEPIAGAGPWQVVPFRSSGCDRSPNTPMPPSTMSCWPCAAGRYVRT